MKMKFSGAGALVPIVALLAFLAMMLTRPSHERDELWVWGAMALIVAAVALPIGIWVNRGKSDDRSHSFMFIPMQYWGGLALVAGLALVGADFAMAAMNDASGTASAEACNDLQSTLAACPGLGPSGAAMMGAMCAGSDQDTQVACLECVQDTADPCNPIGCENACSFMPH